VPEAVAGRRERHAAAFDRMWSRRGFDGNTKYLEVAYTKLRRQGVTINEDLLRHVAPLGWENIGLTGDYVWSTADQLPAGTLRPLRQRQSLLAA
jgi:hypothetical protein